ncbi:MAG: hypothetical protein KatS3mg056_0216 [Chloroflexus sp.]|nr:MAG: hypothetical protein KatS3mg056_0216 [Chloroflexus sp.]
MRRPYAYVAQGRSLELAMHYPHVTLRQAGLHALPVALAGSQRVGIPATIVRCWS